MRGFADATWRSAKGHGRTRVCLDARQVGEDILVYLYNENIHLGAVAVAEFDHKAQRASTSVITVLGHKDDAVAQQAAHSISKHLKKTVCVVAGIHIDRITTLEISEVLRNAEALVQEFVQKWIQDQPPTDCPS